MNPSLLTSGGPGGEAPWSPGMEWDWTVLSDVLSDTTTDRSRETGTALESHYRFILWLIPTVERFPRAQKFLLGDRIQNTAIDVLEALIEATYTKQRNPPLVRANLGIEKLRFLLRIAHDLKLLDSRRHRHAVRCLDTTGRLVGAWRKIHRHHEGSESV